MFKIRFAPAIIVTFALAFVATDSAVAGPGGGGAGDGIGITRADGPALLNVVDPLRDGTLQFSLFGSSAGDTLFVGDWNGDGSVSFGVAREDNGALLWILDFAGTGSLDFQLFGSAGDIPVVGDFDPNSAGTEIGFARPNAAEGWLEWILKDNTPGEGFSRTLLGADTDIPVPGNWDGDASNGDELGVARDDNGALLWITEGTGGVLEFNLFGAAGDAPISGDWSGDGNSQRGVRVAGGDGNVFILDQPSLEFIQLGAPTDKAFNPRSFGQP